MFYVSSVFFMPMLMFTPILSLLTGQFVPIEGSALFPWLFISVLYYLLLAHGRVDFLFRMWQYLIGHWPTYTRAFLIAVRSRRSKPRYKVTRKTRQDGFYGQLVWQQFAYIAVGTLLIARSLFWMPEVPLATRLVNMGVILFYMVMISGICRAAFFGTTPATWRALARPVYEALATQARRATRRLGTLAGAASANQPFPPPADAVLLDDQRQPRW